MLSNQTGTPGVGGGIWATPRDPLYARIEGLSEFPLPILIDATKVYNYQNLPYWWLLYAGTLIGKVTASNLYAPSIIGQTTVAYTSGGTSLTVAPGTATAIVNRIGSSGTFVTQGPPAAAGTNANITTTFSAVNQTTGVITVTSLGANMIAGGLIQPTDGSQVPLGMICDTTGVKFTDWTNLNLVNNYVARMAIGGIVNESLVVNFPTDTSVRAALQAQIPLLQFASNYGF
jgi:hypothetical protein